MTPERTSVLFVAAVLAHNFEEAIWLPGWSGTAGRWHPQVSSAAFAFAAGVLSALFVAVAVAARLRGPQSFSVHLLAGCAVAMVANVIFPHVIATLALRSYAPGTLTALLLVAPTGLLLLHRLHAHRHITLRRMYWVAPVVTVALLTSVPALIWLGVQVAS